MASQTPNKATRLADSTIDTLRHAPMQAAQEVVDNLKEAGEEKSEFLSRFRESFRALDEKVRAQISTNLESLIARNTNTGLEALKVETDAMQQLLSVEAEKVKTVGVEKQEPGLLSGITESIKKSDINPQNWDENTRNIATRAGMAAGIVVGGIVVYRIGKWLFGGTKKVAKKAAEKTVSGYKTVRNIAIIGGLGLLAFLGVSAAKKYMDMHKKFGDLASKGKEELDQMKNEMQKQIQDIRNKGEKVPDALREEIAKLNEVIDLQNGEKKTKTKTEIETSPVDPYVKMNSQVLEVAKSGSIPFIAKGLVSLVDIPAWTNLPSQKELHMRDLLSRKGEESMRDVFAAVSGSGEVGPSYVVGDEDKESRRYAVRLLVKYCKDRKSQVLQTHSEKEVSDMPLEQYIKTVGATQGVVGELMGVIDENNGDLLGALKQAKLADLMQKNGGMDQEFQSFFQDHNGINVSSSELILYLVNNGTGTVDAFMKDKENLGVEDLAKMDPMDRAVYELCLEMQTMKTHEYMIPFFHREFPTDDWSDNMEENKEISRRILTNGISLQQAVRWHFYARMMRGGNPAGVILMQSEIFQHVAENETGLWRNKKYKLMNRIPKQAVSDTWKEWDELDVELDQQVVKDALEKMEVVGGSVGMAVLGSFVKGVWEFGVGGVTTGIENPKIIGVPTLLATGLITLNYIRKSRVNANPHNVIGRLHAMRVNRSSWGRFLGKIRGFEISEELVDDAITSFKTLDESIQKLKKLKGLEKTIGKELSQEFTECIVSFFNNGDRAWSKLLRVAEKHKGVSPNVDEVIQGIRDVAHNKKIQQVISAAAHPIYGRRVLLKNLISFSSLETVVKPKHAVHLMTAQERIAGFAKLLDDGISVDKIMKAGAHADEVFTAVIHAHGVHYFDELSRFIGSLKESKRAIHMSLLCQIADISDLEAIGFTLSDILLGGKNLRGIEKIGFIIDVAKLHGPEKLVDAGFSADIVYTVLKNADSTTVSSDILARAEKLVDAAKATATAKTAAILDVIKFGATNEVIKLIDTVGLDPKLLSACKESPELAKTLAGRLSVVDDPAKLLAKLNDTFSKIDDVSKMMPVVGKITNSKKATAFLKIAESGGDMSKAFSKMAKVAKVMDGLGVAGDLFVIWVTYYEIQETNKIIANLDERGSSEELRSLYMQRYAHHAAALGVAGTGVVAGGALLAGAGGAIASPVLLATLPVSAVLYGAYAGHKWKEDEARSAKDFAAEDSLPDLIVDTREYDWEESIGHGWDLGMGNGEWMYHAVPTIAPTRMLYRVVSGDIINDSQDLAERIRNVDRTQVEAIVIHTTSVNVPETVMGDDGQERKLSLSEVEIIQKSLQVYVSAKVNYIMERAKSIAEPISSSADVAVLMQQSEYYALYKKELHDLYQTKESLGSSVDTDEMVKINNRLEMLKRMGTDTKEIAQNYGLYMEEKNLESMYTNYSLQKAMSDKGTIDIVRNSMKHDIANDLMRRSGPMLMKFDVRSREENIINWGIDGNAYDTLKIYLMSGYAEIINSRSSEITDRAMQLMSGSDSSVVALELLSDKMENALSEIQNHFHARSPMQMWEDMPAAKKTDIEKYQDLRGKMASEAVLDKESPLAPLTHVDSRLPEQKIRRQRKFKQAVDSRKADKTLNPEGKLKMDSVSEKSRLYEMRMEKGEALLRSVGAEQEEGQSLFVLKRLSIRDKYILAYFDTDVGQWKMTLGSALSWLYFDGDRLEKAAKDGREAQHYNVQNMPSGMDSSYNAIIAKLGILNTLELPKN